MSVFKGSVAEYPGVIVDHFSSFNCRRGRVFFLSHCHKDHMTGLDSQDLLRALRDKDVRLYCSEVTKALLVANPGFKQLAPFLESLPTEEPVSIRLDSLRDEKVLRFTLTLLPAGHCPGSVMFLFQGDNGNVLYTGDFRLTVEETKKIAALHEGDRTCGLRTLYLDTTFCHPRAENIASRDKTREVIVEIASNWLQQSPLHYLHLLCPSFGYEHILMAVAEHFKTKVHVNGWRRRAYSTLPSMAQCLTAEGVDTRIHSCSFWRGQRRWRGLPCGAEGVGNQQNVLRIKPSTQWFLQRESTSIDKPYVFLPKQNMARVMHSMHASFAELRAFVTYVQPESIVPCVIPSSLGDNSFSDLHFRLRSLLSKRGTETMAEPANRASHSTQNKSVSERRLLRHRQPGTGGDEGSESEPSTDDEYATSDEQQAVEGTASSPPLSVTHLVRRLPTMISPQQLFLSSQRHYTSKTPSWSASAEPEQPAIDLSFSEPSSISTIHDSQTSDSTQVTLVATPAYKKEIPLVTDPTYDNQTVSGHTHDNQTASGHTHDNQTISASDLGLVSESSKKEGRRQRKRKNDDGLRMRQTCASDSDMHPSEEGMMKVKEKATCSELNSFPLSKKANIEEVEVCLSPVWECIDLTLSSNDSHTEDEASMQHKTTPLGVARNTGVLHLIGSDSSLRSCTLHSHETMPAEMGLSPLQLNVNVGEASSPRRFSREATPTTGEATPIGGAGSPKYCSREATPIGGAGSPKYCSREATPIGGAGSPKYWSREDTPIGGAGSPPFSPQSLGSPYFLPLTPDRDREATESILNKKNLSFV